MRNKLIITSMVVLLIINISFISADEFGYNYLKTTASKIKTFLGLKDTPISYSGEGGNCVKVNAGETALEFGACDAGGGGNPFDQDLNTTDAVTFAEVNTTGWINGMFNWTTLSNWLSFTGSVLSFNETKLNETIESVINTTVHNPFDQSLNTIDDVTFNNLTLTDSLIVNNTNNIIFIENGSWVVAI